jgi:general secretion pathway protein J
MAARTHRGFTLVEVMVALLVMALMAGMAWQGVDGIVRARDASQTRLNRVLLLNTVLAQWDYDLASVQQTPAPGSALPGSCSAQATTCMPASVRRVSRNVRPSKAIAGAAGVCCTEARS